MLDIVAKTQKASGDATAMKELTSRICRDYLHGAWKKVTANNIGFKHISGGLSNLLYHVSLPDSLLIDHEENIDSSSDKHPSFSPSSPSEEPREVLIRVYGQTHGEGALEALITESVIFTLLSERGLGPKLHGIFPGGRIEQYINARPLLTRELADQRLSERIARKMAAIHSMEVPLHKEPNWLWNTIDRWLQSCDSNLMEQAPEPTRSVLEKIDFRAETNWLKRRLEAEKCSVVFCHNDFQEGNILISREETENNNGEPDIVIIDFEYCSYNYRSFDIANHFVEWVYDYTESQHPFYSENWNNYPTEQQRMAFIRAYLNETGSRESPKKIMREVEVFTLASHFFWTIWSLINAETSKIPFGYWEYAHSRLTSYLKLKQKLSGKMQLKRKMDELTV